MTDSLEQQQQRHQEWMRQAEQLHLDLIALRVDCEDFLARLQRED